MDYHRALLYLNHLINYEKFSNYNYKKSYTLDRIKRLLLLLDNPQKRFLSIIVSGTKGKGSCANMVGCILSCAGIKIGVYTSPHMVSVRERVRIGRNEITEPEFADTLSVIKDVIDKNSFKDLTYFEIMTVLAFLYFVKKKIEIAVLEVGLGGRLDAVNAADAVIAALTPISYDHTHVLGTTLSCIAREKCGIIRDSSYVVCAPQPKEAFEVIKRCCIEKKAQLFYIGKHISFCNVRVCTESTSFDAKINRHYYHDLKTPLIGRHQVINALTALGVTEILKRNFGFSINTKYIRNGLKKTKLPGRFQIISKRPCIILDGAHNLASAESLKDTLGKLFRKAKIFLILGISSDKDIEGIGKTLCPLAEYIIFTKANVPRAENPEMLDKMLAKFCKAHYIAYDINDAVIFARRFAGRDDVIVVTGSFFLVADALRFFKNGNRFARYDCGDINTSRGERYRYSAFEWAKRY